jgi:predicted dehydrogenase
MRRRRFTQLLALAPWAPAAEAAGAGSGRHRVAMLGVAHAHAAGKLAALRALPDRFEVAGVAEADPGRREAARRSPPYANLEWRAAEAWLADPTIAAVVVETTWEDATATARRAVRAGKHVHLDKPGGLDHAAFAAMRREAEERKRHVQMGYMLRHNPGLRLVREAVAAGWLGEITAFDAGMGKLADANLRRALREHPGHGMMELGCHLVDLAVTLLGVPAAVRAQAERTGVDDLPDRQRAALRYAWGEATLGCDHADATARRWLTIAGTRGALRVPALEGNVVHLTLEAAAGPYPRGTTVLRPAGEGRYAGEFRELAGLIGGTAPRWDAAHDIAVHAAARRAAGLA